MEAISTDTNIPTAVDAAKVRLLRRQKGLLMGYLAAAMQVSPSYLSRMLSGERPWTRERAEKLAAALGVPVSEVLS